MKQGEVGGRYYGWQHGVVEWSATPSQRGLSQKQGTQGNLIKKKSNRRSDAQVHPTGYSGVITERHGMATANQMLLHALRERLETQ